MYLIGFYPVNLTHQTHEKQCTKIGFSAADAIILAKLLV